MARKFDIAPRTSSRKRTLTSAKRSRHEQHSACPSSLSGLSHLILCVTFNIDTLKESLEVNLVIGGMRPTRRELNAQVRDEMHEFT